MQKNFNPEFILIDGSSYLYRAFHALPSLVTSAGQPTGAIYGVTTMLRKLIKQYNPKYIAVVFDSKEKNFRHELFENYKANRSVMPNELISQVNPLVDLIQTMGIPVLIEPGVEADDVIGTLAKKATTEKLNTLISSGDKDLAQLVNEHVFLVNTMNNLMLDIDGIKEKFGVFPEQIIDYLSLVGDTSDNIPGIPNVGPKTAAKLLNAYGSIDNILKNIDNLPVKIAEYIKTHPENISLSKELTTIRCNLTLTHDLKDLIPIPPNTEKLIELFKKFEFRSLILEKQKNNSYEIILDELSFEKLVRQLEKTDLFAIDTETTSLNYMIAEVVGIAIAINQNQAFYIPVAHDYENAPKQLSRDFVLSSLKPILENTNIRKIGHNIKYDKEVLENHGIILSGIEFDSMIESYIVNSNLRHNLDNLASIYLHHKTTTFEEVAGIGKKQVTFNKVDINQAAPYSSEDAYISFNLHNVLYPKIEKHSGLNFVFKNIEIPLISVLSKMERHGTLIDCNLLSVQSAELGERILELEQEIFQFTDCTFNIDSPKQLQEILYDKLKLPVLKKTQTGQPSTNEETLSELALDFPLPKVILEYRSLSKLKSTYTDKLPELVNKKTKRIHTSYHQAVTATGRLSSSDPNLQNIPIRTLYGRKIRQAFIAPTGHVLLASDYSQIELRIMAHISQDERLTQAFLSGHDIHSATAAEIFGVQLNEVTESHRRKAKAINFGLIYGMSAYGLSKQLKIDRSAAELYIKAYFERYPKVKIYMENMKEIARKQCYVETLFGRRLYIPEINSKNRQRQQYAERIAINAPMQGTAADIIKIAMNRIDKCLTDNKSLTKMILQVHDELVFEIPHDEIEIAKNAIRNIMTQAASLSVPLVVDIGIGNNWDEAH